MNRLKKVRYVVFAGIGITALCIGVAIAYVLSVEDVAPELVVGAAAMLFIGATGLALAAGGFYVYRAAVLREHDRLEREKEEVRVAARSRSAQDKAIQSVINREAQGIISVDKSGNVTFFNKTAERMFGYGWREIVGQSYQNLISETSLVDSNIQLGKHEVPIADTDERAEAEAWHRDGRAFPVELAFTRVVHDEVGELMIVFVKDITERKKEEEKLRQALEAAEVANKTKSAFLANISHE
ncbi:MAG: PAS domain S-box protein, partial [Pseudomonadales bacterium]|nr:PAS domain S-box protein [Pseudomonadales bacterium]